MTRTEGKIPTTDEKDVKYKQFVMIMRQFIFYF